MAENSAIEWTDHTFNPWIGCTKVGPGCDHCYAEALSTARLGVPWGPGAERRLTKPSTWQQPRRWDRKAAATGIRQRVFCASLADIFDNEVPDGWRAELFQLIRETPNLDWLLVTKRIGNAQRMAEAAGGWPENVWLGATIVNQAEADRDIPKLLEIEGPRFRFLSMEPLLGAVDLRGYIRSGANAGNRSWATWIWPSWVPLQLRQSIEDFWRSEYGRGPDAWLRGTLNNGQPLLGTSGTYRLCLNRPAEVAGRFVPCWNNIGVAVDADGVAHTVSAGRYRGRSPYVDWVIVGGESGSGARPMHPDWLISLRDQCEAAEVPFLFKQWGEHLPVHVDTITQSGIEFRRVGKKAAGRRLHGTTHDGVPT